MAEEHLRASPYDPYDHLHSQSPFPAGHTVRNGARSVRLDDLEGQGGAAAISAILRI